METQRVIPGKERWMLGVGAMGQGMVYAIMSSYISDFYLNVAGLPALFVLLLMLLARVWDAVNDPLMGMLVDRFSTRWGKVKGYILFTPLPVAILTVLMFYVPDLQGTKLMLYAAVTYLMWGMTYTVSDVPFWTLPNVMTPNPAERGKLISFTRTLNGIGSALPMAMFMILSFVLPLISSRTGLGLEKQRYMIIVLVCALLGNALFVNSYFHIKERVVPENTPKREKGEPSVLKRIFTCKPLMLVTAMGVLSSGRYLVQVAAIHVARYAFYIGPELAGLSAIEMEKAVQSSIGTVSTVFQVCSAAGMFGAMVFIPMLYKKYSYKQIVITSCLCGFVSCMIMAVLGWFVSFWACIPFIIISCIPLGVLNITAYAMVGDSLDYMEWKTGYRQNGLGSACQSFVNILGNALATSTIVLIYIIFSFDPGSIVGDVAIDPTAIEKSVRFGMFSLVSILPGVSLLLCTLPVFFYDLVGEKKAVITRELAQRRADAEGAAI